MKRTFRQVVDSAVNYFRDSLDIFNPKNWGPREEFGKFLVASFKVTPRYYFKSLFMNNAIEFYYVLNVFEIRTQQEWLDAGELILVAMSQIIIERAIKSSLSVQWTAHIHNRLVGCCYHKLYFQIGTQLQRQGIIC